MEGFCRACLVKYDPPTNLFQYSEKTRRLFVYSTGIQVKRNDTFPFQLCKDCYANMEVACIFKKLCRGSDKSINKYQALKDAGAAVDFCTFMKNNDDTSAFRFPLTADASTPGHNKSKDDDNESTCTSIRNFMTDILQVDELPDTEARIIREVIEEEADVLEDSLDTHWLRDETLNDSRLDFSFSPFSTPRHIFNDHCYTPHRADEVSRSSLQLSAIKRLLDIPVKPQSPLESPVGSQNDNLEKDEEIEREDNIQQKFPRFYIENNEVATELDDKFNQLENNRCVIDSNLDEALKNEENFVFCLDDILVTPPGASAVSTPTINNILFGEKSDNDSLYQYIGNLKDEKSSNGNECNYEYVVTCENIKSDSDDDDLALSKYIEKRDKRKQDSENSLFDLDDLCIDNKLPKRNPSNPSDHYNKTEDGENSDVDILADFFKDDETNGKSGNEDPQNVTDQYDLRNLSCKLCKNKQFKNLRGITTHFYKLHKIHIKNKTKHIKKKKIRKPVMCPHCGKNFYDRPNLLRHLRQLKIRSKEVTKCTVCSQTFKNEAKLRMHMRAHGIIPTETKEKTCSCAICGASFVKKESLTMHTRRVHESSVRVFCDTCGKGFQRKVDLVVHLRTHNGDRPFACLYCDKKFTRRDGLTVHINNQHLGQNRFECCYCKRKYSTKFSLKKHIEISETCMRIRLQGKFNEEDRAQEHKKPRFFVIKPRPLESLQYPNVREMPADIDADIGFQSPYLQSNGMEVTDFDVQDLITPLASPFTSDPQDLVTPVASPQNRRAELTIIQNETVHLVTSQSGVKGLTTPRNRHAGVVTSQNGVVDFVMSHNDAADLATSENVDLATSQSAVVDLATLQNGVFDLATSENAEVDLAASQNAVVDLAASRNAATDLAIPQDGIDILRDTLSPTVLSLPLLI